MVLTLSRKLTAWVASPRSSKGTMFRRVRECQKRHTPKTDAVCSFSASTYCVLSEQIGCIVSETRLVGEIIHALLHARHEDTTNQKIRPLLTESSVRPPATRRARYVLHARFRRRAQTALAHTATCVDVQARCAGAERTSLACAPPHCSQFSPRILRCQK